MKKFLVKYLLTVCSCLLAVTGFSQITTNPNANLTTMIQNLMGQGNVVSNVTRTCPTGASGTFSNGNTTNLNINSGVVLTTGSVSQISGTQSQNADINNGGGSYSLLDPIANTSTFNSCVIEFDVVPSCSTLSIRYVFASEEYAEFVGTQFNDAFAFFVSGPNPSSGNYVNQNIAFVPSTNTPITINTLNDGFKSQTDCNNGNGPTGPCQNCAYYVDNCGGTTIRYDGFTVLVTASINVVPCATYHIIIAIADGADGFLDSGVFLEDQGVTCPLPPVAINPQNPTICEGSSVQLTASSTINYNYSWSPTTGIFPTTGATVTAFPTVTTTYTVTGTSPCGGGSVTATVTVNVLPRPILNLTSVNASCSGQNDGSACVTASGVGPFTYSWSPGNQTTSCISNLAPGFYQVTVTGGNGCTTLAVALINNDPLPPAPVITPSQPITLCNGSVITFNITNFNNFYSYSVQGTPTSYSSTPVSNGQFTVTFNANTDYTFTVTVTHPNNPACFSTSTFQVSECCPGAPLPLDIVTGGVLLDQASELLALIHPAVSGSTYDNQNGNVNFGTLYINGTFTIDVPLFIVNSRVKFGGGAIIDIPNGSGNILSIDKSVLTAGCGDMWDGIYVSSTTELVSIFNKSVVEDALNVVFSTNGGDFFIDRSTLNRNLNGVIVQNYNGVHPGLIWRSNITCLATQLNNFNPFLLPPHATERTAIGVDISNVDFFTVGNNNQNNYTNTFDNMDVGIKSFDCNLSVFNNKFVSITNQLFPPNNTTGRAIWTTGIGETVTIGGLGNIAPNKFDNCGYGVYAQNDQDIFILNNDFKNHTRAGIFITRLDEVNIVRITNKNKFNNMPNGIWCYDNPQADILIDDNDINVGTNPPTTGNGIIVEEIFLFSPNPAKITTITNNINIKSVAHGIWTRNLKGNILIENNKIITTTPPLTSPIPFTEGIFIENTFFARVVDNEVTSSTLSADWWMNGIRASGATNIITCNNTHDIGRGLFFDGVQIPNTGVAGNDMQNNETGLLLNWGVIGAQGFGNTPYDNRWLGTMSACYTDAWASNGLLSPFRVRAGGLPYNPFTSTNCNNQTGTLIASSTCTCSFPGICPFYTVPFDPNDTKRVALQVIGDSITYPFFDGASKWISKYNLYQYLKTDSAFLYSDNRFVAFKDSVDQSNMGTLNRITFKTVDKHCTVSDKIGARDTCGMITPTIIIEDHFKTINTILLESQLDSVPLSSGDIATLRNIASLCPFSDGPAVYYARGVLAGIDSVQVDYSNPCEEAPAQNGNRFAENNVTPVTANIQVYPNPASNEIFVDAIIPEGQAGTFEIYNMVGSVMVSHHLNAGSTISTISIENFAPGVYLWKININGEIIRQNKIVVVK